MRQVENNSSSVTTEHNCLPKAGDVNVEWFKIKCYVLHDVTCQNSSFHTVCLCAT